MSDDEVVNKDKKESNVNDIVKQLESLQGSFLKKMDTLQKEVKESKGKILSKISQIRDTGEKK